jgi:hypothetical protein
MTPGMQIRLWLRTAARGQVAVTAVVLAAVVALLTASVSQGGKHPAAGGAGVLDQGTASGAPGGTAGTTGAVSSGTSGASRTTATSTSGSSGTSSPGLVGPGSTGTTTGAGGTTGGGSGGGGSTRADVSKATDRGVNNCSGTKPCVKLGVLIAKIGGLDASGFALKLRTDIQQVVQAYIDDQNRRGGINGRPIVPVYLTVDPVDQGAQNKACTTLTSDDKVFGVLDTAAFIFADAQHCLTTTTRTPYVHGYAESEGFMDASHGYDVSETRSLDRIAVEWADEMGKLGFLKGGEHVGILEDNCEPSATVVKKYLLDGIKAKYRPASAKVYQSECSAAYAQSQPPALEQQMCVDGVTHVVLATSFVAAQTFLQAADGSPCGSGPKKFRYMASDYSLLASDLFTRNFSKTQFDGSLAITNFFTGITKTSAQLQSCSAVLKKAGLPGLDNSYPNADADAFCDYFAIFVKAAVRAGPQLTRAGWAQQVQALGEFDGAFSPKSVFQPGKTNGGELVHAMVWHADCTCYRQTGPVHQGLG